MRLSIRLIKPICTLAVLLAGGWQAAHADLRVQVEESVNGAPPAPVTHWFGDGRTMRDDGSRYIITSLRTARSTIVDREAQTYQTVPLNLKPKEQIPGVTVVRTDDVREIGGWATRRYHLTGPATRELSIDIWVTSALDVDFSAFRELMIRLGNRPGSEWLKAYEVIEGFPILQQVELVRPGIRLLSESLVVSIEDVQPETKTIYEPPDYFKRVR